MIFVHGRAQPGMSMRSVNTLSSADQVDDPRADRPVRYGTTGNRIGGPNRAEHFLQD
jgi:hypothetical protein